MQPNAQAFRQSVDSGLLLPPELSRVRHVLTRDQWRLLERCTKMLHDIKRSDGYGVQLQLQCERKECHAAPLEGQRLQDGSFQLRCEHRDLVMDRDSTPAAPVGFDRIRRVKPPSRKHRL